MSEWTCANLRHRCQGVPPGLVDRAQRAAALQALAEHLDAWLTAKQLAAGDRADIPQTFRWQAALAHQLGGTVGRELHAVATKFEAAWEARRADYGDAPVHFARTRDAWVELTRETADRAFATGYEAAVGARRDLDAFQHAHAALLGRLAGRLGRHARD